MFDGTDTDFVKERAKEEISDPKLGRVVRVYEHIDPDDNSNFECDIVVDGQRFENRAIEYLGSHSNQIAAPMVGETVLMIFREGENSPPLLLGMGYTNRDRAPLARAGMYRDVYKAGYSPTGDGDIKVTGYTKYSDNPAIKDVNNLSVEETFYQISKDTQSPNPSQSGEAPMLIEMYDSPPYAKDESRITLEGNVVDDDDTKSLNVSLDMKAGTVKVEANDAGTSFGLSLDVTTGEVTLIDGDGYGIESDGSGNFTWHHQSINFSEDTTTSL